MNFLKLFIYLLSFYFSFSMMAQKKATKDPLISKKWDFKKTQVKQAWSEFSKGNKDIIVAVIDTGVDVKHLDLKNNIWTNPKEIPGNNIDDDNNGYIDDVHGWNFVNNNNNLSDNNGHGTHIAGIIGAQKDNGIGISGVSPKVSLMVLKYYDPNDNGKSNLNNTIKSIKYAIKNGAHIINYSGGGLQSNEKEQQAIKEAEAKGILFVAAAGNEYSDINKKPYYPASYNLNNILAVTATNIKDQVLKSSNYGKSIHISAPGHKLLSTLPKGKYGYMTGTSQATAFATGTAVLVMDFYKNKDAKFIIKQLQMTGDYKTSLTNKTSKNLRTNVYKALQGRQNNINFNDQKVSSNGAIYTKNYFKKSELNNLELNNLDIVSEVLSNPDIINNKSKNKNIKVDTITKKTPVFKYQRNHINQQASSSYGEKFFTNNKKKSSAGAKELQGFININKLLVFSEKYKKDTLVTVGHKNSKVQFIITNKIKNSAAKNIASRNIASETTALRNIAFKK